jgi:quercetin dioxygenase-like cupin family protein
MRSAIRRPLVLGLGVAYAALLTWGCASTTTPAAPAGTASTTADTPLPVVTKAIVARPADNRVIAQPWGKLTWYVSAELKNSATMTVGQAIIAPGQANPRHYHPNCDEVLHVIQGTIRHTMDDVTVEMTAGDTVSIPAGVHHNATNIGKDDAILAISFSSAQRKVIGE